MDRWVGKFAVVTGASSGIGEAVAVALVNRGINVIALARRIEKMQVMCEVTKNAKGKLYPVRCDVSNEEDILKSFRFAETLGGVDILVNNAGVSYRESIIDGTTSTLKNVMDVNLMSAVLCTREATRSMRNRGVEGHVINISSVLGHARGYTNAPISLYQPSKLALTGLSHSLRTELATIKAPIKVTNLSPGLVKTEMTDIETMNGMMLCDMLPHIQVEDIVEALLYVLGTPPKVQVLELTVAALHEGPLLTPS
ncbi:hypothetical protein KM043_013936 [Ampulex compressa]|nr:hypothetical protein KM043_013936 [Ampulex compressa]